MASRILTPEEFYRKVMDSLKASADPERAQGGRRFFKSDEDIDLLGIRAADIKKMTKELFPLVKPQWTQHQAVNFCELMLPSKYLEAKTFGILILERFVTSLNKEHLYLIKEWISNHYCSDWATIDTLCSHVLSPLIEDNPEFIHDLVLWADSKNKWLRRASIVSFVKPARRGRYIDIVHKIAKKLFSDEDDLIQKANGWILRESGKTDMKRLEKFLWDHGKDIPRTTLRYAIERFPEEKRKEILTKTRT